MNWSILIHRILLYMTFKISTKFRIKSCNPRSGSKAMLQFLTPNLMLLLVVSQFIRLVFVIGYHISINTCQPNPEMLLLLLCAATSCKRTFRASLIIATRCSLCAYFTRISFNVLVPLYLHKPNSYLVCLRHTLQYRQPLLPLLRHMCTSKSNWASLVVLAPK